MIYLVIGAVAMCNFLTVYNLCRLTFWLCLGVSERCFRDQSLMERVRSRSLYAASWFALGAAIQRGWELGWFD